MAGFLKEWRAVILIALILLMILAGLAVFMNTTVEAKRAVCFKSAQRFTPPAEWRWTPWGSGDGCEILMGGTWFPADMVFPALK